MPGVDNRERYDRDFDRIAAVTGQPTQWIVPPGSGSGDDR